MKAKVSRNRVAARFKIDRYTNDIPELLRICYEAEVERRGRRFIDDAETKTHIQKVAKWLVDGNTKAGLFLRSRKRQNDDGEGDGAAYN